MPRLSWTQEEDDIVAERLSNPSISLGDLRAALAAIGYTRSERSVESRFHALKRKEEAQGGWLRDPFLTKRRCA